MSWTAGLWLTHKKFSLYKDFLGGPLGMPFALRPGLGEGRWGESRVQSSQPAVPAWPAVSPGACPSLLCLDPVSSAWCINGLALIAPAQITVGLAASCSLGCLDPAEPCPGARESWCSTPLPSPVACLSIHPFFWLLLSLSMSFVLEVT